MLAIDDVRCGFRLDTAGSDHYFGFKVDLMCFCKAIANGWSVSALCGIEALKDAAASVMYTGSYWLSAVPFAAGIACVNKLRKLNVPGIIQEKGRKLTEGLAAVGKNYGFDLKVTGVPSMWYMRIANDDSLLLHQEWVAECVCRGAFFTNHHNQFMNCAVSDEDIRLTLEIAEEAFKAVKRVIPKWFEKPRGMQAGRGVSRSDILHECWGTIKERRILCRSLVRKLKCLNKRLLNSAACVLTRSCGQEAVISAVH